MPTAAELLLLPEEKGRGGPPPSASLASPVSPSIPLIPFTSARKGGRAIGDDRLSGRFCIFRRESLEKDVCIDAPPRERDDGSRLPLGSACIAGVVASLLLLPPPAPYRASEREKKRVRS